MSCSLQSPAYRVLDSWHDIPLNITILPAVQLSLQFLNSLLHHPAPLLLLFILLLPLLCCELQVHCDCISNGLGSI